MTMTGEYREAAQVEETREVICEKHGAYMSEKFKLYGQIEWSDCAKCELEREAEAKAAEASEKQARMMKYAGVPQRFLAKGLEHYRTESQGQQIALLNAKAYSDNFAEHRALGRCLLFVGRPGTGKTHLAVGILKRAIASGFTAKYVRAFELIEAIRATWRRDADRTEAEVLADYTKVDLLILDEVGVAYGKEAETVELFKVLDTRYLDVKPSLILSNVSRDELQKYLGERALDRLREGGGKVVAFDWESERSAV